MNIYQSFEEIKVTNSAITVGMFDGVHRGHRYLLEQLMKSASDRGIVPILITFWPHPQLVINKNKLRKIDILNSLEEKISLLQQTGLANLLVIPFTPSFSELSAAEYIQLLHHKLNFKLFVGGPDHRFGKNKEGNMQLLADKGIKYKYEVLSLVELGASDKIISSSSIRNALHEGNIAEANGMLGYNYFIDGTVVFGEQLGRTIGFPTANIVPSEPMKLIPKDGVYAVKAWVDNFAFPGMLNIGYRPTLNQPDLRRTIEVHLLDFNTRIYGKKLRIEFFNRVRDEIKFPNIDSLKLQIENDKLLITKLLNASNEM
jgi:riboflavin kinase / FMN adenylyltransferase